MLYYTVDISVFSHLNNSNQSQTIFSSKIYCVRSLDNLYSVPFHTETKWYRTESFNSVFMCNYRVLETLFLTRVFHL